jgi:DNA topoisomerase-1
MEKSLLIVESPAKAKTINKYLGKDYIVEASVGHIKNLPKSKLSVDVDNGFEVSYETIAGKEPVIEKLKANAAKAKTVFIATDPDREGEAIAAHIAGELKGINKNIKRVLFHEITETGVKEGMAHPKKIDQHMVMSQQARRALDRIVGYKVTPFIWKTMYYGLSAGRVQSVAVRLICDREVLIKKFIPEEYWSITAEFRTLNDERFFAKLTKVAGEDPRIPDETTMKGYLDDIQKQEFVVGKINRRSVKRNPPAPFITSTLQQEAARRLRMSTKRTMMLAQKLYEGVNIGDEGPTGLITYMRTDSTRLSEEAVAQAREYIYNNYGKEYVPKEQRHFKKGKSSQDAHEAIRPTSMKHVPKAVKKYLDKDMYALYELIWNRFLACQMTPAEFEQISVDVEGGEYMFRATDQKAKFRGFLQVFDDVSEESAPENEDMDPTSKLPEQITEGMKTAFNDVLPRQHFTKPPARYTEASLVKELESLGIGRPSTYAMIVSTVIDRNYVEQKERKLFATDLGIQVNDLLISHFPEIVNVQFTARMETELDTIASGKKDYITVMQDFYEPFYRSVEKASSLAGSIKKSLITATEEKCELCGKPMVIKWGRNGRFMACSGYPACKNTKPLEEDALKTQHVVGGKCELCDGDMIVKGGRFGTFLGCSNYPTCKNTKPISMGIKCPKCTQGDLVERKTKKGKRVFYGCSRYPECDFASWDKPVNQACPSCHNAYIVSKYSKTKGEYLMCPACKQDVTQTELAESA